MSDLALQWDPQACAADLQVVDNDLASDDGLETAVMLSLFTDRRAEPSDLPEGETDARGWWADAVPVVEGDAFGSRLWLLAREKERASIVTRAEAYAREALQWLVEDRAAESVEVAAEIFRPGGLGLAITIQRPRLPRPITFRVSVPTLASGALTFGAIDMPAGGLLG